MSPQAYWVMRTFQLLLVDVVPPMLKRAVWQVFPVRSASTITKKNIKSCTFHDNFLAVFQNYFWTTVNNLRDWSPKFETGISIIIKSTLYSIFWQDSITNIKINSFQIFWRLCNPFFWEYTKDLLGVYFGYNGGVFGLYLSYSGAILELYRGYLILGV